MMSRNERRLKKSWQDVDEILLPVCRAGNTSAVLWAMRHDRRGPLIRRTMTQAAVAFRKRNRKIARRLGEMLRRIAAGTWG